ncbi:hypothetical protein FGM00_13905 [Aggregatimonas sangjinii]|uniref:Uncharacterized protein n=1 Tax=Aggregatimonas sangjinii TaxID=2583587 RepID=A0A5B7SW59_9FLAO|nr:hypothetical protein [Aggregatimonas sangjinii]QCX01151.1 hypothetical protein FGM00_13905 [Aggregatimonas sangjinii]
MESKETDRYSKLTRIQKLKIQAYRNVKEKKQASKTLKLTPAMRAGLRARIAQRAEKDPEYAKKVDRKIKEAQERNKKE